MCRYLVQSLDTGRFLVPDFEEGEPRWETSLMHAGAGIVREYDRAIQLAKDWAEIGEAVRIVDLDRLGTADDYDEPDYQAE